ncbi:hypothetical protein NKG05_25110 [Oerskovia sp. M15]
MIFRTAATSAALAIGLALVGAVTGPQWDPTPSPTTFAHDPDTTIGGQGPDVQPVGTYAVQETPVVVRLDGASVDGIVREPVDAPTGCRAWCSSTVRAPARRTRPSSTSRPSWPARAWSPSCRPSGWTRTRPGTGTTSTWPRTTGTRSSC